MEVLHFGYADRTDVSGAGFEHSICRLVSCYFLIPRENKSSAGGCDVLTCRPQVHVTL